MSNYAETTDFRRRLRGAIGTRTALLGCFIILAVRASAQTSSDFETFHDGDSLSSQISNLTFTNASILTKAFSLNDLDFPPHSGQNSVTDSTGPITIQFTNPVGSFSAYFTHRSALNITAFSSAGAQIATATSLKSNNTLVSGDAGASPNELLQVTAGAGIAKVVITGGVSGGTFVMDDIATTLVPTTGGGGGGGGGGGVSPFNVTPTSLTFDVPVNSGPAKQTLTLNYPTVFPGNYAFGTTATTLQGFGWLSVSPESGTMKEISVDGLQHNYQATISVIADPAGIRAGSSFTGTVNVSGGGGLVPVAVTLNVTDPVYKLTVSPATLTFSYRVGDPKVPASQPVAVSSAPAGAAYTATAATTSGGRWLSVTPPSGSAPGSLNISVNPDGLAPGDYKGSVVVTSGNSPSATIPVAFTVIDARAPVVTPGGVVPVYSSVTSIQSGSWISIFGSTLATTTAVWNGEFPTTLGGVSVTLNGKAAYLWFVSPTQINLQAPDDDTTGAVEVVVKNGFGTSKSTVTLAPSSPSFSLLDDGKHVAGVILTPDLSGAYGGGTYDLIGPDGAFPFSTRPAKPGENLILFGVGFGPTNPSVPAGQVFSGAAPTVNPVVISIGGIQADVAFAGLTAAGLYQFNVTVPDGATGEQPLQATVNGVRTQAGPVVSLQ